MKLSSRRRFLKDAAKASAGMIVAPSISTSKKSYIPKSDYSILEEVRKFRKMDAYSTANLKMEDVEKFGIERIFVGKSMPGPSGHQKNLSAPIMKYWR